MIAAPLPIVIPGKIAERYKFGPIVRCPACVIQVPENAGKLPQYVASGFYVAVGCANF
jgi:hypothetical protein